MSAIRFELADPIPVRLSLHDVTGREVARLFHRVVPAGESSITWDGRDATGRQVAAGVYFVRLESPDGVRTHKLVLAR